MDIFTLFAVNATILAGMACAFFAAWRKDKADVHWLSWIGGNLSIAAALLLFMLMPPRTTGAEILPGGLLLVGFGLWLQAARRFMRARCGWTAVWLPCAIMAALFMISGTGPGLVHAAENLLLAGLSLATAWRFRSAGDEISASRKGLVIAYGVIAGAFALRAGLALSGQLTGPLPQQVLVEVHLLVTILHAALGGAFVLSMAHERAADRHRRAALRDALTGLHNRHAFTERMHGLVAHGAGQNFALLILDLDRFREVNERHGHMCGDIALEILARICAEAVRETDFVARIGGEEFAVILFDVSAEQAVAIGERIRGEVEAEEIALGDVRLGMSLGVGVYQGRAGEDDFDAVMGAAEASLHAAKAIGRGHVRVAGAQGRAVPVEASRSAVVRLITDRPRLAAVRNASSRSS